jgi:spore maturation protein CgeB
MNARNPHWLSCAAVDPDVNHKCSCPKEFDLVFIGSKTPRRLKILEFLSSKGYRVYSPNVWDPVQMNEIFNKSRIVLNIHLSDLPNTETRIAEVLGAGSFLLSEKISSPDLLEDGAHYASWTSSDLYGLTERIDFYLANDSERERIAAIGYHHFHQNHTVEKRLQQLFKHIDFDTHKKIWPSYGLGIPFSTDGKPTLRVDAFYEAVSKSLKDKRIVNVQGSYKRCTRKSDVARDPIITSR